MILANAVESTGIMVTILTSVVAVPLTVLTFYLRSMREHQMTRHADLAGEVESVRAATVELRKTLADIERDYTTKEEWLRECMDARRALGQLSRSTIRLEATLWTCLRQASPAVPPVGLGMKQGQPTGPDGAGEDGE